MKKILSVLLCASLAFASAISANAASKPAEHKGFKDLHQVITIPDNTVKVYAYNIDKTHTNGIRYKGGDTNENYYVLFKDCINLPQTMKLPSTEKYARSFTRGGGNIYPSHSFTTTGGKYKKIRIKLSEFNDYFNEDGSHTEEYSWLNLEHDYKFKYEDMGNHCVFNSALAVISGGVVTGITPDKNGEAEFFVSTEVGRSTEMMTTFSFSTISASGGGGGTTGGSISSKLRFGNIDGNYWVDVDDVTALQLYLSGQKELDTLGLFHADVDCDGIYDVSDVTALQFGIAK